MEPISRILQVSKATLYCTVLNACTLVYWSNMWPVSLFLSSQHDVLSIIRSVLYLHCFQCEQHTSIYCPTVALFCQVTLNSMRYVFTPQ